MTHVALAALRSATADQHRDLDTALPLMSPALTVEEYRHVLGRFWGLVAPLESALDHSVVPLEDWPERRKAQLLAEDLGDVDDLPLCPTLPEVSDTDRALGCLYVLEGSTLGGRHVRAQVERTLGPGAVGTRYFDSYGDLVPRRWRRFRVALAQRADAGGDVDAMTDAARSTFAAFHHWVVG